MNISKREVTTWGDYLTLDEDGKTVSYLLLTKWYQQKLYILATLTVMLGAILALPIILYLMEK